MEKELKTQHILELKIKIQRILELLNNEINKTKKIVDILYHDLKIDIINSPLFDNQYQKLVIDSLSMLFIESESVIKDIEWWLYEDVDKIITLSDGTELDITTVEKYTEFLINQYKLLGVSYE